ncbi:hypothetical protein CLCR_04040 [Cladophialophora carrionii]|uniref:Uncharacterized protein n=1 Tax=Cladophialophora carrionii TaxID=86049 RepID=A0A1C1CI39_9EURO|nr:hypothetical protein CLCR_04040 [Cladophialophora carrionii]
MSVVLTQTSGVDYTPKYLFVSGDRQRGTGKSRHVMKEFLRKRDSIRRQKQLASRSQSRVLPWLRREDMEQGALQTDGSVAEAALSSDSLSDTSSRPSSPQQSQRTAGSTVGDSHSSPTFSSSGSNIEFGGISDTAAKTSHTPKDLVINGVISKLYGTKESSQCISPASAMAHHIMTRPVSSRILLAISSLNHDIETGHREPTSDTLALVVEGISLLQQHIQRSDAVSEDAILTVLNLWAYEVTLSMGFPTENQKLPQSVTHNIQTHLNGLQRSIKCFGGVQNLSSETLWLLAWCVSTMPGYWPIDNRTMEQARNHTRPTQPEADGYYFLTRLFDTLSNIQRQMSSPDSLSSILHEESFSSLRKTLLRLNVERQTLAGETAPIGRLRKSVALAAILLFIFDVLLGGTDRAHQEARGRRKDLLRAQRRLIDHRLDEEGSLEKVWSVLMTQQEEPHLQLHARAWSIVEMVNVIKHLHVPTIDALSQLLFGYLLPESRVHTTGDYRYERLLVQIHFELDGLADLS